MARNPKQAPSGLIWWPLRKPSYRVRQPLYPSSGCFPFSPRRISPRSFFRDVWGTIVDSCGRDMMLLSFFNDWLYCFGLLGCSKCSFSCFEIRLSSLEEVTLFVYWVWSMMFLYNITNTTTTLATRSIFQYKSYVQFALIRRTVEWTKLTRWCVECKNFENPVSREFILVFRLRLK